LRRRCQAQGASDEGGARVHLGRRIGQKTSADCILQARAKLGPRGPEQQRHVSGKPDCAPRGGRSNGLHWTATPQTCASRTSPSPRVCAGACLSADSKRSARSAQRAGRVWRCLVVSAAAGPASLTMRASRLCAPQLAGRLCKAAVAPARSPGSWARLLTEPWRRPRGFGRGPSWPIAGGDFTNES
jgi:hypothetical protein